MKTSIEIEFKTLISKEDYERLLKDFDLEDNVFTQVNYYLDSPDFFLRNNNMALRIRHKNGIYKLTLKRPHEDGCLYEDSVLIDEELTENILKNGYIPKELGLDIMVYPKAELITHRVSTPYQEGRLFFDKSEYNGCVDYEVEYEADDLKEGLVIFHDFLKEKNIPYKQGLHKIDRVYNKLGI